MPVYNDVKIELHILRDVDPDNQIHEPMFIEDCPDCRQTYLYEFFTLLRKHGEQEIRSFAASGMRMCGCGWERFFEIDPRVLKAALGGQNPTY